MVLRPERSDVLIELQFSVNASRLTSISSADLDGNEALVTSPWNVRWGNCGAREVYQISPDIPTKPDRRVRAVTKFSQHLVAGV